MTKRHYNIASSAAQSNSVYVSVLKIPMVHADSVCKSLRQKFFFFARAAIVSAGKNDIFRDNMMDTNRPGLPVPKRRQFSDLFPWARVLKWGENEKNNGRGDSASAPSRFASLSLLILLSVSHVGFNAQFHRLCYETIGSYFWLCTIELWSTWEVWSQLNQLSSKLHM